MPVGAPRPGLKVGAQGVLLTVAKQSADREDSRGLSGRANLTENQVEVACMFPASVVALPGPRDPGAISTAK